jgi:hypothetical protein
MVQIERRGTFRRSGTRSAAIWAWLPRPLVTTGYAVFFWVATGTFTGATIV